MSEGSVTAAAVLSLLGGVLTTILGALYAFVYLPPGAGSVVYEDFGVVGGLAILAGMVLIIFGVGLIFTRDRRIGVGVAIIVVSALTFWGGFLFVPGIILCVVGGLLAILHEDLEQELPEQWGISAARQPPALLRECPSCGKPVGLATKSCPECGAQLSR